MSPRSYSRTVSTPALGWSLASDGSSSLTATVDDWSLTRRVQPVTGSAIGRRGIDDRHRPPDRTQTTVKNGSFSIPTGIGPLGATLTPPVNRIIRCRGGSHSCQAQINFAGGARRREIVIRLTASNLSLRSVRAASSSRHPVYRLSGGHFVLGGSEYAATLERRPIQPARFASDPDLPESQSDRRGRDCAARGSARRVRLQDEQRRAEQPDLPRHLLHQRCGRRPRLGARGPDPRRAGGRIQRRPESRQTHGKSFPLVALRSPLRSVTAAT